MRFFLLLHVINNEAHDYWDFLHWLILKSKSIGMKFSTLPWTNQPPGTPKHIVYAEMTYASRLCFGLGNALNERLGHAIAAAESLERAMMYHAKLMSSNGCAVHMDIQRSRKAALRELVERDAFLCHFYTGTHLDPIPASPRFKELSEWAASQGARLHAGSMRNALGLCGVVVGINEFDILNPSAFFIGLGISESWEESLEKAFPEAWRFYDHWKRNKDDLTPLTVQEFIEKRGKEVRDHVRLSMDKDYSQKAWDRIFPAADVVNTKINSIIPELSVDTKFLDFPLKDLFDDCPLQFSAATNPALAEIGFGDLWHLSNNRKRYESFHPGKEIPLEIPHCIG